ncbi:DUF2786 domain-containing protein [Nocardia sp. NPDC051052]|uniref:DUF2786 domain-containing protein n=1 Tax=Nocardia sp. NPDC051052 TaxID=3364322 RepID=UPI0037B90876
MDTTEGGLTGAAKTRMLQRIRMLLERAASTDQHGSDKHEAERAREKAEDLLDRYGLDIAEVFATWNEDKVHGKMVKVRMPVPEHARQQRQHLLGYLAAVLHCQVRIGYDSVLYIGAKRHTDRVKALYPFLLMQMFSAAGKWMPDIGIDMFDPDAVHAGRESYMIHFATTVTDRIYQGERARWTSLIDDDEARANGWADKVFGPAGGSWRPTTSSNAGAAAGAAAGRTADIGQTRFGNGRNAIEA